MFSQEYGKFLLRGKRRMRKQNTKTTVPLDAVPERRTKVLTAYWQWHMHSCRDTCCKVQSHYSSHVVFHAVRARTYCIVNISVTRAFFSCFQTTDEEGVPSKRLAKTWNSCAQIWTFLHLSGTYWHAGTFAGQNSPLSRVVLLNFNVFISNFPASKYWYMNTPFVEDTH